ncbi:MAG: hypothetical protein JWQ07_80 [Ramlibacter sp.]|nr:hypothetical protein [Ramlibacter sp.]
MAPRYSISSNWAQRALTLAMSQGELANSPCEPSASRNLSLCAASCIAFAGLQELNPTEADSFMHRILSGDGKREILFEYGRLGLSEELAVATMALNDRTPRADRLKLISDMLA